MGQAIAIFSTVMQLLSIILQAIKAAEQVLPETGRGAEKLDLVKGWIQSAYNAGGNAQHSFEEIWPLAESVIAGVVKAYKAIR